MTVQDRLMLFVLSALCTVIVPAVMLNTYHTLSAETGDNTMIAVIGLIPLVIVLAVCFGGLFYSIFRVGTAPRQRTGE